MIQSLYQFYPLTKGQILLDGTSAQYFEDLEAYRSKMAYISQESVLFRGTLRSNLDMSEQFSDQEIFQALIKVGLNEFADEQGLKRNIEERGKNLSLGEKQLLCMARCLLQKAPIIIMDEATSSVDPQSEAVMVKATEEFFHGRTQIIIAHRLSTLERCDQILWLENGEIKMIGNPSVVLPIFSQKHQDHPLSSPV
jgi:ABC-type multidrug transport system fused ATPase/permease subunit